jgi:predicted PilT family ATPase
MGLEMKTPENCENSLRNRKKKENGSEKSEKSSQKSTEKVENEKVEQFQEEVKEKTERKSLNKKENDSNGQFVVGEKNFRIRFELDPMSIALFTLAVVTRFFRLAEPRNVVLVS